MPSRWACLLIVAFWLAATGWLFWREVWPQFQPGEPPPFVTRLVDETQVIKPDVRWRVFLDGKETFRALTSVHYRDSDETYEFHEDFRPPQAGKGHVLLGFPISCLTSLLRVGRDGDVREVEAALWLGDDPRLKEEGVEPNFRLRGEVRGGQFAPVLTVRLPWFGIQEEQRARPVKVSYNGAVMLALQPVHQIKGLRYGQSWRLPLVDPLTDAMQAFARQPPGEVRYLSARVLPDLEPVEFDGELRPCLVIAYEGEEANESARTWVEPGGEGRVLKQEAVLGGKTMVFLRDSAARKVH
jgi:hypothetical protein